jgi:hypothetical protein
MSKINKLLIVIISLWIVIAAFRTFYNLSKLYTEERYWIGLSNEEKRAKYFGDIHYFLRFLDSKTSKGSQILFLTNDLKSHYLGRYYIYPDKELYAGHDLLKGREKKKNYDFIAIYPTSPTLLNQTKKLVNLNDYKKYATYKDNNGQTGVIFTK